MTARKKAIIMLLAVLVLLAGCVTEPHTYIDKKHVKLTVPGCS
ncbi:MAG: hypothetical protein PVG49_01665 [Desulfobacteraceae bacterium]|jgi:hypothetical protein